MFTKYIAAMGWLPAVLVIGSFIIAQSAEVGGNMWLSRWSDDADAFNVTSKRNMNLGVYASFGLGQGKLAYMF